MHPPAAAGVPTRDGSSCPGLLRPVLALALLVLVVTLLNGSVADVGRDRRLLVAVGGLSALDPRGALLVPGSAVPLDLTVSNPYAEQVTVTRLLVTVTGVSAPQADGTRPCGVDDFVTTQAQLTALPVPPRSTTSLARAAVPPEHWPSVRMANLERNQDGCRRASVSLAMRVWGRVG